LRHPHDVPVNQGSIKSSAVRRDLEIPRCDLASDAFAKLSHGSSNLNANVREADSFSSHDAHPNRPLLVELAKVMR